MTKPFWRLKGANSKTVCLSFYYHMYGGSINRLNIYNNGQRIWTKEANQGNSWNKGELEISGDYDVSVVEYDVSVILMYTTEPFGCPF